MPSPTVIIFGPTGHVGSATALHAQQQGARVILALRDPTKSIPSLSRDEEKAKDFQRVQADLTAPETVKAAVRSTGAKHAFVYLVPDAEDYVKETIEALKDAGIQFVVFLSSSAVRGDIREIKPASSLAYAHARVEIGLGEVFGLDGYIALRPGYFDTNVSWWVGMIREGEVKIAYPDARLDWIAPGDVGRVAATVVVRGMRVITAEGEKVQLGNWIPLRGPELVSQRDAVGIFGRAVGRHVRVTELGEEEGVEVLLQRGVPEVVVRPLVGGLREGDPLPLEMFEEGSRNVWKYAGRAMRLEEWAEDNRDCLV